MKKGILERTIILVAVIIVVLMLFFIVGVKIPSTPSKTSGALKTASPSFGKEFHLSKKTWRDLSMAKRKNIYLRVTDVPPGLEADRAVAEMARKYNISKGNVLVILSKGTFEWGWGDLP